MTTTTRYRLISPEVRAHASAAVWTAPEGWECIIRPERRTLDQNALIHAMFGDIEKAGMVWAGRKRIAEEIKVLMVSGHTIATTGEIVEVVQGFEGEPVQLRESTAAMSKARLASLADYITAWCAHHDIKLGTNRKAPR